MNTLSSALGLAIATGAAAAILLTPACGELFDDSARQLVKVPTQSGQGAAQDDAGAANAEKRPIHDAMNTLGAAVIDGVLEPVNVATQQLPPEAQALAQAALAALDHALDQGLQAIMRNDVQDPNAASMTLDKLRAAHVTLNDAIH